MLSNISITAATKKPGRIADNCRNTWLESTAYDTSQSSNEVNSSGAADRPTFKAWLLKTVPAVISLRGPLQAAARDRV
ncbi:hypothetical protein BDS110ZK25_68570 [Bradyrhizobium diazoefficiens]